MPERSEALTIPVLDNGYVRLVEAMGSDLSVVRSARVSYNAEWRAGTDAGSDVRLINYLMRNRHTSPFESVVLTFEVKAPIFVFRQWHRHRTMCLSGATSLVFERPCDGKAYPLRLEEVVQRFNHSAAKRRRVDQSPLSLKELNRQRVSSMTLRSPAGDVHLVDAWYSGEKKVYELVTRVGSVTASADHVFKTPEGSHRICDGLTHVMAMHKSGLTAHREPPVFSSLELRDERWVEFADGYEVSDLGRVRSYWRQGRPAQKKASPTLKTLVTNPQGRQVVSIKSKSHQVSRLVAAAFLGASDELVLHKDDNPFNNRLNNLYYGSAQANSDDQYVNGGRIRLQEGPVEVLSVKEVGIEPTFDITVTGNHWFVANNLIVHNSYNELSARYTQMADEFYVPRPEHVGIQSSDNKQVRTMRLSWDSEEAAAEMDASVTTVDTITEACRMSFETYKQLLRRGVPREIARTILPVSTYSKMFATVSLHNLFHFLKLRLHPHAQYEIRQYAEAMLTLIKPVAPVSVAAFIETQLVPQGYNDEQQAAYKA